MDIEYFCKSCKNNFEPPLSKCQHCGASKMITKLTCKELPDRSFLAIHLLLIAAQKGAMRVELSNDCLQSFFGVSRVYPARMEQLGKSFRPFFPRYAIGREPPYHTKYMLTLYIDENDDGKEERKTEYIVKLDSNMEKVYKELGVKIIEAESGGDTKISKIEFR